MRTLLIILLSLSSALAGTLPNGCGVYAVEAQAKLKKAGIPSRVLIVRTFEETHSLTIYAAEGKLLAYDYNNGSRVIARTFKPRSPQDIAELLYPAYSIREARWLSDL